MAKRTRVPDAMSGIEDENGNGAEGNGEVVAVAAAPPAPVPVQERPEDEDSGLQLKCQLHDPKNPAPQELIRPGKLRLDHTKTARRQPHTRQDVQPIIDSLLLVGQEQPIDVIPLDPPVDGFTHDVVSGYGRVTAALAIENERINGRKQFPLVCRIQQWDEKQRLLANTSSNKIKGAEYTMIDIAIGIERLMTEFGYSKADVAKTFGLDVSWVTECLSVYKTLSPKEHEMIVQGLIPKRVATDMVHMTPARRAKLVERIESGEIKRLTKLDSKAALREQREAGEGGLRQSLTAKEIQDVWQAYTTIEDSDVVAANNVLSIQLLRGFAGVKQYEEFQTFVADAFAELAKHNPEAATLPRKFGSMLKKFKAETVESEKKALEAKQAKEAKKAKKVAAKKETAAIEA